MGCSQRKRDGGRMRRLYFAVQSMIGSRWFARSKRATMLQSKRKKVPMVTLKLNKSSSVSSNPRSSNPRSSNPRTAGAHTPVRGAGSAPRTRPTLAEAQEQRAEREIREQQQREAGEQHQREAGEQQQREARYQEQLRQRFGNNAPPAFNRGAPPEQRTDRIDRKRAPQRDAFPAHQQNRGSAPRQPNREEPRFQQPPGRQAQPHQSPGPNPHSSPHSSPHLSPSRPAFEPRYQNEQQHPNQNPRTRPQPDQQAPWQPHAPTDFRDRNARDDRAPAPPAAARKRAPAHRPRHDSDDFDTTPQADPNSMRLSKRMSELGIASRREADEWIPKGWVRVDGRVVSELGSRVLPSQQITVDAKAKFVQAQKVTVILNKPIGYVSGQAEDGYEPAVVLIKPANQWREDQSGTRYLLTHLRGIAPAGRLDIDSVGLLVLTQDGRIAKQLIGEDSEMEKEYLVRVELAAAGEAFSDAKLALLNHGLELDGEALRPALVEWINQDQLRFVLKEGKKRQIRRMCEAVGLKVTGLKRVRIGDVMLGDLPVGAWRYMRGDESFVPLKPPTSA